MFGASFLRESEVFRGCGPSARCTLQEARQGWLPCPEVRAFLVAWGLLQGAAASPPGAAGLPQGLSAARSLLERVGRALCTDGVVCPCFDLHCTAPVLQSVGQWAAEACAAQTPAFRGAL